MGTGRVVWITAALVAWACAAIRSNAIADDIYARSFTSARDSAVPGEYFFSLGVDAVKAKDYRHAVAMYKVAASWAYKPAQYNLGVIFAKGEGVPEDSAQGLAWLTLAAERGDTRYAAIRDRVRAALTPDGVAQADALVIDLSKIYGDEHALRRAKNRWREVRNNVTGSHVGSVGNLKAGSMNPAQRHASKGGQGKSGTGGGGYWSAADMTGGESIDGSVAYRELRETDNPYDPRFDVGTVTVGDVTALKKDAGNEHGASSPADSDKNKDELDKP